MFSARAGFPRPLLREEVAGGSSEPDEAFRNESGDCGTVRKRSWHIAESSGRVLPSVCLGLSPKSVAREAGKVSELLSGAVS